DFLRLAVARRTTPVLAALSNAETTTLKDLAASSFFPEDTAARKFFSSVCRRDLTLEIAAWLRLLLRIRRSADLVFGIKSIQLFNSERDRIVKRRPMSKG